MWTQKRDPRMRGIFSKARHRHSRHEHIFFSKKETRYIPCKDFQDYNKLTQKNPVLFQQ